MTIRCGCRDEADEIVFGPDHQCSREGRAAVNLQAELDRLEGALMAVAEMPWETTLDESERHD